MSNPDDQEIVKKNEQEDTNQKANEQAAEQAAADKALKDNAESEPADEVSASTGKGDEKKEEKKSSVAVAEKVGGSGMTGGSWAQTTMETLTEGMTMRQEFAEGINKAIFNKLKDVLDNKNPTPKSDKPEQEQHVQSESEQESSPQIEMQSMSDTKAVMIEGPKADELDSLSTSSQSPDSSPDSEPSLDNNDTPTLGQ